MLDCRDEGRGPAVLLLHGCPGNLSTFDRVFDSLRSSSRVIAPALPGYHGSPALRPYDYDAANVAVRELLRARGIERLEGIVGFSFGTWRALSFALSEPTPAPVVCALGGFAGLTPAEQEALRGFVPVLRGRRSNNPELRQILVERNLCAAHRARRPEDARLVETWLDATTPDVIADEIDAITRAPDLHARLPSAQLRLFVRVGSEDVATPPEQARRMAQASPGASLEVVPGLGHAQLIEDPDGTAEWVRRAMLAKGVS